MIKMKVPIMLDSYYIKSFDRSVTNISPLWQEVQNYIVFEVGWLSQFAFSGFFCLS